VRPPGDPEDLAGEFVSGESPAVECSRDRVENRFHVRERELVGLEEGRIHVLIARPLRGTVKGGRSSAANTCSAPLIAHVFTSVRSRVRAASIRSCSRRDTRLPEREEGRHELSVQAAEVRDGRDQLGRRSPSRQVASREPPRRHLPPGESGQAGAELRFNRSQRIP
jgi:hypothetical protein